MGGTDTHSPKERRDATLGARTGQAGRVWGGCVSSAFPAWSEGEAANAGSGPRIWKEISALWPR